MNQLMQLQGLLPMLPEAVLVFGAMLMLMAGVFVHQSERSAVIVNGFCIGVLALAGLAIVLMPTGRTSLFEGSFVVDDYARFLKLLALTGSIGTLKPSLEGIKDIGWREAVIFAPLVILTILFGVAPGPVLDMSAASVAQLLDNYQHAIAAAKTAALIVQ